MSSAARRPFPTQRRRVTVFGGRVGPSRAYSLAKFVRNSTMLQDSAPPSSRTTSASSTSSATGMRTSRGGSTAPSSGAACSRSASRRGPGPCMPSRGVTLRPSARTPRYRARRPSSARIEREGRGSNMRRRRRRGACRSGRRRGVPPLGGEPLRSRIGRYSEWLLPGEEREREQQHRQYLLTTHSEVLRLAQPVVPAPQRAERVAAGRVPTFASLEVRHVAHVRAVVRAHAVRRLLMRSTSPGRTCTCRHVPAPSTGRSPSQLSAAPPATTSVSASSSASAHAPSPSRCARARDGGVDGHVRLRPDAEVAHVVGDGSESATPKSSWNGVMCAFFIPSMCHCSSAARRRAPRALAAPASAARAGRRAEPSACRLRGVTRRGRGP